MPDSLRDLTEQLAAFSREREWQQFHSPKNLASALIVEAAELLEHFQWMSEAESRALSDDRRQAVASEIADVLNYLVQLSAVLGIDPIEAARRKIELNAVRYPVERARGNSRKYDED